VTNDTNVILDINGYFASSTGNGGKPGAAVAERVLAQTGLSIALANNVLFSQPVLFFGVVLPQGICGSWPDGTGSMSSGGNTAFPMTSTFYYDTNCTQPYIAYEVTAATPLNEGGDPDDLDALLSVTATYYGLSGTNLGAMTLTLTIDATNNVVSGVGVFTPAAGLKTPVQLGLYCDNDPTAPCVGAVAQNFPALDLAIGAVTTLDLAYVPNALGNNSKAIAFSGGGSPVTGPIGSLTLTNPSETSLVMQGGTVYTSITASGGAAEFDLFPPTPTSWTVTDTVHDEQFQISVIDDATRSSNLTIKQISTGNTLASGTVDRSGTGTITYSDGSFSPITAWTLAD